MSIRKLVKKLGLLSLAKILLMPVFKARAMEHPTFGNDIHDLIIDENDYHRYVAISLAIKRIQAENIAGSIAEVGVYQGRTSKIIRRLAPEKPYYLFDTFEGFPQQDLETDKPDNRFDGTSVDLVMKNIGTSKNIIIKQGYVPDTFEGMDDEQYSFVLLDLDLYNPTLASLEYFYPRMAVGGYIMIHDYNSPESDWACMRSVDKFMADKPEQIIEVADICGSAMFRKI